MGRPRRTCATWFAPDAADELLALPCSLTGDYEHADVLRIILARAARSARRTTHFDLDFPRTPQLEPYWCHKHKRECRPIEHAGHFVRRYTLDTLVRLKEFSHLRGRREAEILHGDARELELHGRFDAVVTSPPYPGLIDYHEQHRYAYELLELDDRRERELGAAAQGTSRAALDAYVEGIAAVLGRCAGSLKRRAPLLIVVNDRRELFPAILERAGLRLDDRYRRHVNRRTGRRAGEYFEDVLVAREAVSDGRSSPLTSAGCMLAGPCGSRSTSRSSRPPGATARAASAERGTSASAQARIVSRLAAGPGSSRARRCSSREYRPVAGWVKVFCGECGSSLWSRSPDDSGVMSVRLGAFDGDDPGIRPSARQFVAYAARLGSDPGRRVSRGSRERRPS